MKIFIPQETISRTEKKHIFIDTCFFLDYAYLDKKDQITLSACLKQITDAGSFLVTMEPVAFEFYLGSDIQDLEIKQNYVNQIVESIDL